MDRVLLIDPTDYSARLVEELLNKNGFYTTTLSSSSNIIASIKINQPDVILMDTELIRESGYDVCKRLKAHNEAKYIPVLLMGINESNIAITKAFESGADDFLPKTYEPYVLISKVKSLMRLKYLSDELKNKYTELEEKNDLLNNQMKMAMNVQRSLISEYDFKHNGITFYSKYLPAIDIGGDFYDIIKLNENVISVVIGDVSGHGISAALLTAMLNMMIKTYAPQYYNPSQFLYHMNNAFYSMMDKGKLNMYASMFYAVIDTKKKRIYYGNAGQPLPIFIDARNQTAYELQSFGTPIGLMPDSTYDNKIQLFNDEDMILFYTDGLSDNLYKNNVEDFYIRLTSMLLDMSLDTEPSVVVKSLLNVFYKLDVKEKDKYELDDISVILCKMNGEDSEG